MRVHIFIQATPEVASSLFTHSFFRKISNLTTLRSWFLRLAALETLNVKSCLIFYKLLIVLVACIKSVCMHNHLYRHTATPRSVPISPFSGFYEC